MIKLHTILFCLLLTLITACSGLHANRQPAATESNPTLQAGKSTPQLTQYTNSGTTCFEKAEKPTDIKGFAETGCLSFCASHITDTLLVIVVDSSKRTIKLDTKFVEESDPDKPAQPCLTACQYGRVDFAIRDLEDGTYTVWLGDKAIGEVNIPLKESTCLVSQ